MRLRPASWRRAAIIVLAVVIGGAVLWSGAWLVVAYRFEHSIDAWVAARRAEGWQASHGAVAVSGFPHRWRARIERPSLSRAGGNSGGFSWSGPWIVLGWAPWTPRTVTLSSAETHALGFAGAAGGRFRLTAAELSGLLTFRADGAIVRIGACGDALTVTPPSGEPFLANRAILRANLRPDAPAVAGAPPPTVEIEADILGLTLPETSRPLLGRTIGHIAGRATVKGAMPALRPAEALAAWRDQGGVVEISRFSLGWGTLAARGDGTLALDAALQPIGAMTARIAGYAETIDRLTVAGKMTRNQGLLAKVALAALARTPEGGGRPEIAVPVSIQDRVLVVGPVRLIRLPRIVWR